MAKICILNGAGKKNGNTAAMIKVFADAAAANGNEIKEFYLQTMNIHSCLDCGGCRRKEKNSENPCVQKDDMAEIYAAFKNVDVLVFASPVYWWDITGIIVYIMISKEVAGTKNWAAAERAIKKGIRIEDALFIALLKQVFDQLHRSPFWSITPEFIMTLGQTYLSLFAHLMMGR